MKNQKSFNFFIKNGHNIVLILASILFIASLFYSVYFINNIKQAEAQSSGEYLSGWAWGDNFGWVSFNCNDNSSCGSVNYRVDVASNGNLSGYAWSDNVGWITFNESDLSNCPSGECKAKLSGNNLQGWARALSYGDGWDGWISLNGSNYGVILNGENLEGFTWDASDISGQSIGQGWINFNPPFGGVKVSGKASSYSCVNIPVNAIVCADDYIGLLSNTSSVVVDVCSAPQGSDPKCEYVCYGGYVKNGNTCTAIPQCSDGIDNDGDGQIDYPTDGECSDVLDNDESTIASFECSDSIDNDGDGQIDYPQDTGCLSANDDREQNFSFIEF